MGYDFCRFTLSCWSYDQQESNRPVKHQQRANICFYVLRIKKK
jgi:hypothetical protein